MARLAVYTTQQGVQGIYCAVSVVLALWLWVLLMLGYNNEYCQQPGNEVMKFPFMYSGTNGCVAVI